MRVTKTLLEGEVARLRELLADQKEEWRYAALSVAELTASRDWWKAEAENLRLAQKVAQKGTEKHALP